MATPSVPQKSVSRRHFLSAVATIPAAAALAPIMPLAVEAAAPTKIVPLREEAPARPMAELKRQIDGLDHDHLVALDLIITAIEDAQGDRARVAALEEKLAPWFHCHTASHRVLVDLIAEWRAEGEPEPIVA